MKFTIVTVCYNAEDTIARCIESVLSQDFKDYEYIIIDGSSSDGTKDILRKYSDRIAKMLSEPDSGIYDAMNKGLTRAEGDWILFLNSDDVLYNKETLSSAANYIINKEKNYYGIAEVVYQGEILYRKPRRPISLDFEHDLPIHQTVFISKKYKYRQFDKKYTISADSVYMYKLSRESEFEFIPVCISSFSLGGVSSWYSSINKYLLHVHEHIAYLAIKKSSLSLKIYTIFAFTCKYILSKITSKYIYFKIISYVLQIKARF